MNLEESNRFVEEMEKNSRKKKTILTTLMFCAILIVILLILIVYFTYKDSKTLKMYINGKQTSISSNLLIEKNGENFFNIKQLASMLEYSYQQGEYNKYNEDENHCYIKNDYVTVTMSTNEKFIKKYYSKTINKEENEENEENEEKDELFNISVKTDEKSGEKVYIKNEIILTDDGLYVPISSLEKIFNVKLDLSNNYRIKIYKMDYLIQAYLGVASKKGYTQISNYYENLTAIIDDMLVVSNEKSWGILSLINGEEIVSLKYDEIIYRQGSEEFQVSVENSVGIISTEGKTIIKPTEYDSITKIADVSKIDETTQNEYIEKVYLVEKNGKYGITNDKSEIISSPDYDYVGIRNWEYFDIDNDNNVKFLFEKSIPVECNGKVGIININGEEKLKCVFDSFGYIEEEEITETEESTQKEIENKPINSSNDNILIIPEKLGIKGIIVKKENLYGIYDAEVESLIVPCVFNKIYSKTKGMVTTYYIEYNGQEENLEEYLIENDLKSIK